MLYPTACASPGCQERSAWWERGAMPVTVDCSAVGESSALVMKRAVPGGVADAFGLNRSATRMLFPAGIVTGRVNPTRVNSELVDPSDEMVTEAFEAVRVAGSLALNPSATFPKLSVAGVTTSCAPVVEYTPVPATCMLRGEFRALLPIVRVASVHHLAVGLKTTPNCTLVPGRIFTGNGHWPNEKACPDISLERTYTFLCPVFVSLTDKELNIPIRTSPNQ